MKNTLLNTLKQTTFALETLISLQGNALGDEAVRELGTYLASAKQAIKRSEQKSSPAKMSRATTRAVLRYGRDICIAAHLSNEEGNGANTISWEVMGGQWAGKTRCAGAAIDAGRELALAKS